MEVSRRAHFRTNTLFIVKRERKFFFSIILRVGHKRNGLKPQTLVFTQSELDWVKSLWMWRLLFKFQILNWAFHFKTVNFLLRESSLSCLCADDIHLIFKRSWTFSFLRLKLDFVIIEVYPNIDHLDKQQIDTGRSRFCVKIRRIRETPASSSSFVFT